LKFTYKGTKIFYSNRKRVFRGFERYVFGTLGNEANIVI